MVQPKKQKYVINNEHVIVPSFTTLAFIFLSLISLFLFFGEVLFAEPFSSVREINFSSKLEFAVEKISVRLLENEDEVVIAVVDVVNNDTQERDAMADVFEEKLTDLLFEKLPNQVVPYFEIVNLRLEWKSRFPDIRHDPLTEDIAKLTDADWLLTGTHQTIEGLLSVNLNLYDLKSGDLLWQTVVTSARIATNEEAKNLREEMLIQKFEQKNLDLPFHKITKLHAPNYPFVSRPLSSGEEVGNDIEAENTAAVLTPPAEENSLQIPQAMQKISAG